jgi:hypothetical protein
MATKYPINATIADCGKIIAMWKENPTFMMDGTTLSEMQTLLSDIIADGHELDTLGTRTIDVRLRRTKRVSIAAEFCTRARSVARGVFGVNATQLKQAGATLRSERKPRARPASTAASSQSA